MKSYMLLRNNTESGPYTKPELEKMGLQPADLIWIEGESRSWKFPAEIDELKSLVRPVEKKTDKKPAAVHTATPGIYQVKSTSAPMPAPDYSQYLHAVPEPDEKVVFTDFNKSSSRKTGLSVLSNMVALLILAVGVAMAAYVVRGIVLSFGGETFQSAQAAEIQSVNFQAEYAAYAPEVEQEAPRMIQETVEPVTPAETKVPEKTVARKKPVKEEPVVEVAEVVTPIVATVALPEVVKAPEQKPAEAPSETETKKETTAKEGVIKPAPVEEPLPVEKKKKKKAEKIVDTTGSEN